MRNKVFRYAGIEYDDVANGENLGAVVFTQFCPHHCKECQNHKLGVKMVERYLLLII